MTHRAYTRTLSRRGRPRKKESLLLDSMTPEMRKKRKILGIKRSNCPHGETFVGVLFLRGLLEEEDYQTCLQFMGLSWKARKTLQSPLWFQTNWEKMRDIYGDISPDSQINPYKGLSQGEIEEIEQKRVDRYQGLLSTLLKQKDNIGSLTLDVVQYDKPLNSLVMLQSDQSHARGQQDLQKLKLGIEVIKAHLA